MNTKKLTQKQKEALEPLEAEARANRKARDRHQKRLALEHAIGFEENKVIKERIEELDAEYKDLSVQIAEIYAAESDMTLHMRKAMAEVDMVKQIADRWGFDVDI